MIKYAAITVQHTAITMAHLQWRIQVWVDWTSGRPLTKTIGAGRGCANQSSSDIEA